MNPRKRPVDITTITDTAANTLLCGFDEIVFTAAGRIEPNPAGMTLFLEGKRPRRFPTAKGALGVLRRAG